MFYKVNTLTNIQLMLSLACNDECTGVLLDEVDILEASIHSLNLSGVILAPYTLLISLENQTQELQVGAQLPLY